jgi:transcriptional regulator with XRE-family HTH domain
MDITEKIQNARADKDISTYKMAQLLEMTQPNYFRIENNQQKLTLDLFIKICGILKISPSEMISETDSHYVILKEEDLTNIESAIRTLNRIKNQILENPRMEIHDNQFIQDNHGTIIGKTEEKKQSQHDTSH